MRARTLAGPAPALALALAGAVALAAQEPAGSVEIRVDLDTGGTARVEERYEVVPAPRALELRALTRPCTWIEELRVERAGVETTPAAEPDGPWLLYRTDTPDAPADTLRVAVRYRVRLGADRVAVPLVHLTAPIAQRDGEREGTVHLSVRFADADGRVRFPHLARDPAGGWEARFVAIPSFVEVARGDGRGAGACDAEGGRTTADGAGDGGLTWRFLLFVGIMAVWVPLYLAWARRTGEGRA